MKTKKTDNNGIIDLEHEREKMYREFAKLKVNVTIAVSRAILSSKHSQGVDVMKLATDIISYFEHLGYALILERNNPRWY